MENNKIHDDEIDLRELFLTLWENKVFIIVFTAIVTFGSIIYALFNNPAPIYQGKVLVEVGQVQGDNFGIQSIDNPNNVVSIVNTKFANDDVVAQAPRGTTQIIEISMEHPEKDFIKKHLNTIVESIITRHSQKIIFYDNYIMTEQVTDIIFEDEPINTPRKNLIIAVAFVTGFILSIFLVFFREFIKSFKQEDTSAK